MNKKTLLSLSVTTALAAAVGFASVAHATTKTASVAVTASVAGSCKITGGTVAFGAYDPTSATALTASGTVVVACTKNTTYTVGLDTGLNTANAPSGSTRAMVDAGAYLGYDLYSNSGATTLWTNSSPGWVSGTGAGGIGAAANQTLNVYGSVPVGQFVTPGTTFTDTVTATITY
ncbi:MAG: spore coat U domain-containing protein [Acidocella sp.]|nr:spore coat U domain-containing protein [Acidocella sp.]